MVYHQPLPEDALDQGDLIDGCLVLSIKDGGQASSDSPLIDYAYRRVVLLTQTCDLANAKATSANVAEVFAAQHLIDLKLFKPSDVQGPLRSGRVWGWYFLPADQGLGLEEMIVDLRRLPTVPLELLRQLSRSGKRPARVAPLYREHLAKHFADTFSRIGLPQAYETL